MRSESISKAIRCPANSSAAGEHRDRATGESVYSGFCQAIPKIMVFTAFKAAPPAGLAIGVGTNSKICAVHVWMRTVWMDQVRATKVEADTRSVFAKRIDVDGSSNSFNSARRSRQLVH
jgi:hypothetical protein